MPRGRPRKWTDKDIAELRALAALRIGGPAIAKTLGRDLKTVYSVASRFGIKIKEDPALKLERMRRAAEIARQKRWEQQAEARRARIAARKKEPRLIGSALIANGIARLATGVAEIAAHQIAQAEVEAKRQAGKSFEAQLARVANGARLVANRIGPPLETRSLIGGSFQQ